MKTQKLSVFLADNKIQKNEFAQAIGAHKNQISYWIRNDFFIVNDNQGNWFLMSNKRNLNRVRIEKRLNRG